ncbi:MAG: TonB-dependent receptor [Bacteroidota bacterium]
MTGFKSALSLLLFCTLCAAPTKGLAQSMEQDSSHVLPTVDVNTSTTRASVTGSVTRSWAGEQLEKLPHTNLAELLDTETGAYIKSYGMGSLATSSIRGGSAGHTLVLWNGLPIQSPMLGLLDLSLLPINATENITFTKGGNGAMWGSGAIGGVINLENHADFTNRLAARSGTLFGSFGQFQQQLDLKLGRKKLQSITRLSHQQAENDFFYFIAEGFPERQQTNASLSQQFLAQDLYWKINQRNHLAVRLWWQQSDRQIPPTNVQNRSQAHQDDVATRLLLEYKHFDDNGLWHVKTAFFEEQLDYFDDLILLESRSRFRTFLAEINRQWTWGKHELLLGNFNTHTRAWSAGYRGNIPSEYRTALFASWAYKPGRWQTQFSLRQEMVDGVFIPLVPALGFSWQATPSFSLHGKVSRNYRLPTFNDRFWLPGGNPDLLPESGWSQELTMNHQIQKKQFEFDFSLTAYHRKIDNWILWSQLDGQSFWSANNITSVRSWGLEPRMTLGLQVENLKLQWRAGYDYVRSTNLVKLENPRMAEGEQLIYTPIHQAFSSISLDWKGFHLAYRHQYIGPAQGINDPLDAFQVGRVRLQYQNLFQPYQGTLFLNVNNIWDADYLVVERRPMPGIQFQVGLNLSLHVNQ